MFRFIFVGLAAGLWVIIRADVINKNLKSSLAHLLRRRKAEHCNVERWSLLSSCIILESTKPDSEINTLSNIDRHPYSNLIAW